MILKVLVGCEFSATVRDAFRKLGHDAWSCDLTESEGDNQFHFQGDIMDGIGYGKWDLIILHLPCTAIALCGNSTYGKGMPKHNERLASIQWTAQAWNLAISACDHVAFENPKNVMGAVIGKRTQTIQPFEFGHPERKETWLWLHGLPALKPTKNVFKQMMKLPKKQRERLHYMSPSANRGKERARFFTGWAEAMAIQWSDFLSKQH